MSNQPLDEVDKTILFELQRDARITNTEIADRIDMSASTVGKRITRLQDEGIIKGHQPKIVYRRAEDILRVLFICTAPITERESLIQETLDLDAVVNVHELMTGQQNVHIQIVGQFDDVTSAAHQIDKLGFTVNDEILMRATHSSPAGVFGESNPDSVSQNDSG